MIRVWSDGARAGVLDRFRTWGSTFAYEPGVDPERAVSLTMPVRVASYDWRQGLVPIFEMNLPEGVLRERLIRRFAKATGHFDDLDLLGIVGRSQLGRVRYSGMDQDLDDAIPFQSVDEILRARRDGGLFDHLLETFSQHSGVSGVQPKVLVRDERKLSPEKVRLSSSLRGATHIVKMWDPVEFPELAANEHFCLMAAHNAGLRVPPHYLSDSGDALVVERFDLTPTGYLGMEDFCVLNGLNVAQKYRGGYEGRVLRRIRDFVMAPGVYGALRDVFRLLVLNCAVRNGDAHLKNFALVYANVNGEPELAPVYDVVTTTAYLPGDTMALSLGGSNAWPDRRVLLELGTTRCELGLREAESILERTAEGMRAAWTEARAYFQGPRAGIGERMLASWEEGIAMSLGLDGRL